MFIKSAWVKIRFCRIKEIAKSPSQDQKGKLAKSGDASTFTKREEFYPQTKLGYGKNAGPGRSRFLAWGEYHIAI